MTMSLLVMGHSFVRRMKENTPEMNYFISNTTHTFTSVNLKGIGGLTVEGLRRHLLRHILVCKPTVIVLDIGTNDLAADRCDPCQLATAIVDVARDIRRLAPMSAVMVLPIMVRMERCRYRVRPDFNAARKVTNDEIAALAHGEQGVYAWRHSWVTQDARKYFLRDGVHLNELGMKKYVSSVRRAALFGARMIAREVA